MMNSLMSFPQDEENHENTKGRRHEKQEAGKEETYLVAGAVFFCFCFRVFLLSCFRDSLSMMQEYNRPD
jgi:hypothetical protein